MQQGQSLFFIAARNISLIRSCQPGPSSWKKASTSLSILSETSSFVFGSARRSTACSGFFFAGLNNASAASIGLTGLRGEFAIVMTFYCLSDRRMSGIRDLGCFVDCLSCFTTRGFSRPARSPACRRQQPLVLALPVFRLGERAKAVGDDQTLTSQIRIAGRLGMPDLPAIWRYPGQAFAADGCPHGIEKMILSLNAPAVQAIPDKAKALEISRRANDFLAEQCVKNRTVSWDLPLCPCRIRMRLRRKATERRRSATTCRNTVRSGPKSKNSTFPSICIHETRCRRIAGSMLAIPG